LRQVVRVKCADCRVETLDFADDLMDCFHALGLVADRLAYPFALPGEPIARGG
jgi:hypothetical protein